MNIIYLSIVRTKKVVRVCLFITFLQLIDFRKINNRKKCFQIVLTNFYNKSIRLRPHFITLIIRFQ